LQPRAGENLELTVVKIKVELEIVKPDL